MKIKYKDKIYDSEKIPLFFYFKRNILKREFTTVLVNYKAGKFKQLDGLYGILAGNTVIRDKRSKIYFCIDDDEERKVIMTSIYKNAATDNAMLCSPGDIPDKKLFEWIEKNVAKLRVPNKK